MTMAAGGVAKLIEECGELTQILGKRLAYWSTETHPDGKPGTITERMADEIGDVIAAAWFVAGKFDIGDQVAERAELKKARFEAWDADPGNNTDSIDTEGGDGG